MVGGNAFSRKAFLLFNAVLLIMLAIVTLYPFLYITAASLSNKLFIQQGKVGIIPQGFTLAAYKAVIAYPMLWRAYANTLLYCVLGTSINMLLTIMGAYPLSRQQFVGRGVFMFIIVFTMWFSAGMIPTFLVVREMGLYNTIWALLLPAAVSTYNLIVMRSFFQSIPVSLEEAALIDGCNDFQTLIKVVLPLSIPALVTIGLFYVVGHWNSFMPALIYLRTKEMYPLQIILREIILQNETEELLQATQGVEVISESVKYATIIVAVVPILSVYPFIQKYFVKGVMIGAVKG